MKKYLAMIAAAVVLLSTLVLGAVPAAADGTTTVNSTVPLMVNGITVTQFPATVNSGDVVSVVYAEYYISAGERYTFQGWSDGTNDTSITATGTGTITANWAHEILIQVTSVVASLRQSLWLPYGDSL